MDNFLSMMSNYQSDALITKEILSIISSIKGYNSWKSLLRLLFAGLGNIISVIIVQYYIKDPTRLIDILCNLIKSFLYRKMQIKYSNTSLESHVINIIRNTSYNTCSNNSYKYYYYVYGIPFYFSNTSSAESLFEIEYCAFIHDFYIRKVFEEAKLRMNKVVKKDTIYNDGLSKATTLFPSSNYTQLAHIAQSFFRVVDCTNMFKSKGILINGEPGLGKTNCIDYIASLNIVDNVTKIDMTTRKDVSFEDIVKNILSYTKYNSHIVLLDEIDKYLDFYIKSSYSKIENKPTYDEYRILQKEKFLYGVLELLECRLFNRGIIIIFTCNNFESIFEGIDMKHFHSLMSRFLQVEFNRCHRDEFCKYLHFLNDKFINTEFHREDIDQLVNRVGDINLTYRMISDLTMKSCFDLERLVDLVSE